MEDDPTVQRVGGGEIRPYHGLTTLKKIFENQATLTPEHAALEDATGTQSLTYGELNELAESLAAILRDRFGVCIGSRVCLAAERTVETLIGMLAILKAGGAYVPLGLRYPDASLEEMIQNISPQAILCSEACVNRFVKNNKDLLYVLRRDEIASRTEEQSTHDAKRSMHASVQEPKGNDLAYIIFTSGTSGKPKGVEVSNLAVARYIDSMRQLIRPSRNERVMQIMELTFDSSVFDIWVAWAFGGTVLLCHQWTVLEELAVYICKRNVTVLGCTPTQLSLMSPEQVPSLRIVAIGGEAVPPPLIEKWSRHPSCRIYNQYGPTEATVTVTSIQCSPGMKSPKSIGYANPGSVKLYILDSTGRPVDADAPGELCISGPQLAVGYFNRPDLTAEKFVTNPFSNSPETRILYKTGDLCRWLSDGSVEYIGRIDSQVKLRGFRIELGGIESKLLLRQDVGACAVDLRHRKGPGGAPFLCAYLVSSQQGMEIDLRGLRLSLVSSLPDYMVPAAFVTVESLPLDSHGKMDKRQLPDPHPNHFLVSEASVKPEQIQQSSMLDEVTQMFAQVLGLEAERIGLDSNFLLLGGASLSAARFLGLVHQHFGTRIRFADFYAEPTPGRILKRLKESINDENTEIPRLCSRNRKQGEATPLASGQSRMYYLHELDPSSSVYHMTAIFDLRGDVHAGRLERSFREITNRHDILRSSYEHNSSGVFQTVYDAVFSLQILDLRYDEGNAKERRTKQATTDCCSLPFRLDCPGTIPMRALLVQLEHGRSRLVVVSHHIAMDGLSWDIFYAELSAAYSGDALPPLDIQFADFSEWEAQYRRSHAYHKQLAYWCDELGESPPILALPTDRPRQSKRSCEGDTVTKTFQGLAVLLRDAAAVHATTPFCLLLSAYFILLHRLSGQDELIVGILSSGRSQPETDKLLGMFVNTLPIRLKLDPDKSTFGDIVARLKRATTTAFDNQDVALEDIVRRLVHPRQQGQTPLVQTMLTMDVYDENDALGLVLDGLEITEIQTEHTVTTMFDFSIGCSLGVGDDLIVEAEFATDMFDVSSASSIVYQFESILREVLPRANDSRVWDNSSRSLELRRDYKPAVTFQSLTSDTFVEPQTTEEIRLARIFCDVLDLPLVDVTDSFFALGGDSLLSLRLVAQARSIGYYLNVSHVLELESVRQLAEFLLSNPSPVSEVVRPDEEPACGPVDLIPIQRWFIEENFPVPSHYNQSRLYQIQNDVDTALVEASLLEVVRHHDALRLSFKVGHGSRCQMQYSADDASRFLSFRVVDVTNEGYEEMLREIKRESGRDQSSLDVEKGPIVSATIFLRALQDPPLLFVVIHHLVVDEVSWGLIEDDLNLAYSLFVKGLAVSLPPKSHSFVQWATALREYSSSPSLQKELEYWKIAESSSFRLPLAEQSNERECEREISMSVAISQAVFLNTMPVQDVVITALAFSLAEISDSAHDVSILTEGHGREGIVAPFDLSRTIGWFTAVYPVRFNFDKITTAKRALDEGLRRMRAVPNKGIGYGLLKYPFSGLSPLSGRHASQVTFNFLGRSGTQAEPMHCSNTTNLIVAEADDVSCSSDWDPSNQSDDSILDISCHLAGRHLEVIMRFRSDLLSCHYVEKLSGKLATNIETMIGAASCQDSLLHSQRFFFSDLRTRLESKVNAVWDKHLRHDSFNGMAVSAVVDGKVISAEAYGFRNAARDIRATPHTIFSLGSAGKPFVSMLSAVLADEGLVDLDEALAQLLSATRIKLPNIYMRMTLRQLLSMTAGIPDIDDDSHIELYDDPFEICRNIEIVDEPGTRYMYSNFSYALAGYFLALSVGGKDGLSNYKDLANLFLHLLEEKVFIPIGMKDARPEEFQFLCENGVKLGTDHVSDAIGSAAMLPSGPVKASVMDTAQFLITEFQKGLSPSLRRVASEERISERHDISVSLGYDGGMGWFIDRSHRFLHVSGYWADAVSGFKLDPATGFGLSYSLSVRNSTEVPSIEMDVDRLFIETLGEVRRHGLR